MPTTRALPRPWFIKSSWQKSNSSSGVLGLTSNSDRSRSKISISFFEVGFPPWRLLKCSLLNTHSMCAGLQLASYLKTADAALRQWSSFSVNCLGALTGDAAGGFAEALAAAKASALGFRSPPCGAAA